MGGSDDLHLQVSPYANGRLLFVLRKYAAVKIMQRSRGVAVGFLFALWLPCPRVLGELFMKVLTEEEQVQQGAFLWRATPANSRGGARLFSRPLDFNDGPLVSLCEYTAAFSPCQLETVVVCRSGISAVHLFTLCFFPLMTLPHHRLRFQFATFESVFTHADPLHFISFISSHFHPVRPSFLSAQTDRTLNVT